jgi:hypothetical protein
MATVAIQVQRPSRSFSLAPPRFTWVGRSLLAALNVGAISVPALVSPILPPGLLACCVLPLPHLLLVSLALLLPLLVHVLLQR